MLTLAFILLTLNALHGVWTAMSCDDIHHRIGGMCAFLLSVPAAYGVALVAFA